MALESAIFRQKSPHKFSDTTHLAEEIEIVVSTVTVSFLEVQREGVITRNLSVRFQDYSS